MPYRYIYRRPGASTPGGTFDVFNQLSREMGTMLDRFQGMFDEGQGRGPNQWDHSPALDFDHDEKGYHLSVELPGMKPEDVNIEFANGTLTISGEKQTRRETGQGNAMRERSYGRFFRSMTLPEDVESDRISASFENGVLEIEMPRSAEKSSQRRRIEIASSTGQTGQIENQSANGDTEPSGKTAAGRATPGSRSDQDGPQPDRA